MVNTAEQTARNAEATNFNRVGYCLQWCRQRAGIDSLWRTATLAWQNVERPHFNRDVPRGAFAFWVGGSTGSGHIAIGLGDGLVRSTDADGAGRVATRSLAWFDDHWPDLIYRGWADNVNGVTVPGVGDWFDMATEAELRSIVADVTAAQTKAAIEAATPAIVKATVQALLAAHVDDVPEITVRQALRRAGQPS